VTPEFQREPHLIDAILPTLGVIRGIVEIGCHRMEDTLFLRKTFPGAQIFAFDPDPRNSRFIRDHRLAVRHDVTFFEMAVADEDCVRDFYISTNRAASERDEWTRSSSLRPPRKPQDEALLRQGVIPYVVAEKPIQVTCRRLDTFKLQPDFIWCDAQGSEADIVRGG